MRDSRRIATFSLPVLLSFALAVHAQARQAPTWTELGPSATGGGISSASNNVQIHAVAVDRLGRAVVAWVDSNHVYLRRWNGAAWEELGGSATGGGVSGGSIADGYFGLALDSNNNPCLAYTVSIAPSSNSDVHFRRWDGSSWGELGGSASGGGISQTSSWSTSPGLVLDANDNPYVTWSEFVGFGSYEIYLRRWDGQQWAEVGGSASGGGVSNMTNFSHFPKIAMTPAGNPVVAWRYDPGSVSDGSVAYANQELCLRAWNGSAWEDLGGSGSESGVTSAPTGLGLHWGLAVDASGYPILTWRELGPADIILRRWDGSAWTGLGNSASPGGLSNTPTYCSDPSLVLDAAGNPIVAWEQGDTAAAQEICVRRWTGASWEPIAGSDENAGISNTSGASYWPRMALSPLGRVIVAWLESTAGGDEVWLKEWNNTPDFNQRTPAGSDIETGGTVAGLYVRFAAAFDIRPTSQARLEIEIRPVGVGFVGVATAFGESLGMGQEAQAFVGPLEPGKWHWRARVSWPGGEVTPWTAYGGNAESEPDFISTEIPLQTFESGGSDHDTGCGLTGLEAAMAFIVLTAWVRRRRRQP